MNAGSRPAPPSPVHTSRSPTRPTATCRSRRQPHRRQPEELHPQRRHLHRRDARARTRPARSTSSSRRRRREPRTAFLQVNDTGPIAPHSHEVTLTGTGTFPNDPKARARLGRLRSARITWVSPTATRFAGVRVVRNHAHFPANAADGTVVRRSSGAAADTGLKHFTTYYYRVFAKLPLADATGAASTTRRACASRSAPARSARRRTAPAFRDLTPHVHLARALHPDGLRLRAPAQRRDDHDQVHQADSWTSWRRRGATTAAPTGSGTSAATRSSCSRTRRRTRRGS